MFDHVLKATQYLFSLPGVIRSEAFAYTASAVVDS